MSGEELWLTEINENSKKNPRITRTQGDGNFTRALRSSPKDAQAKIPRRSNLGTFTGSVKPSVDTKTDIKNNPIASNLESFVSCAEFNMSQS